MDLESALAANRALCVESLGECLGNQLADVTRLGIGLAPASPQRPATGQCRLAGPALLDPGTAWPEADGLPLSLFAVLDMDELAPRAADQSPVQTGLLNFFSLDLRHDFDLNDPRTCAVIPAASDQAVEVTAPAPLTEFETVPLHAECGTTLPGPYVEYAPDVWERFEPDDEVREEFEDDPRSFMYERFADAWVHDPGRLRTDDQVFGWPMTETHPVKARPENGDRLLLTLTSNNGPWEFPNGGSLMFYIPEQALQAGDLTQTFPEPDAW